MTCHGHHRPGRHPHPGLNPTGALNGNCRDQSDLDNSQTYARSKCNNGWCAVVYASYFEKDQALSGSSLGGHRHDFEHVISWINQSTNQVGYVTTTQHSSQVTYPRSQVRFDGSHPKVVYHKDGASTHFFRLASSNDEPPENHYHNWRYPALVDWDRATSSPREQAGGRFRVGRRASITPPETR